MLDVMLCRVGDTGLLEVEERIFRSSSHLARFFASDMGDLWDWAEVTYPRAGGSRRTQRYSADELRSMAEELESAGRLNLGSPDPSWY
jgi:hypothetical protein